MRTKKFRNSLCLLTLTAVVSLLLAGCPLGQANNDSSETNDDNTSEEAEEDPNILTVKGTLGSSISIAKGDTSRGIGNVVSHIASIPIIAGQPGLGSIITTPVNADGTFSMDIPKESGTSTLFLMENKSSESLEERTQGFLSLNSTNGVADLVLIPTDLASRSLDFGTVTLVNGVGVGSRTLESQKDEFTIEFDKLLETAYHDDLFKHIKNQYVNTDHETGDGYSLRTRCYFTGSIDSAVNKWWDYDSWVHTKGFNIRVDSCEPKGYTYQDLVDGVVDVEMIPPQEFTIPYSEPALKFSPTSPLKASIPLQNDFQKGFPLSANKSYYPGNKTGWILEFDGLEDLTDGIWKMNLLKGGEKTELAVFDMQSIDPFTANGSFIYYVPSFRVITDANNRISRIDLAWYAWNPFMEQYERVSDLTTFKRLTTATTVAIMGGLILDENGDWVNDPENFLDSLQMTPQRNWYLGTNIPSDGKAVEWIVAEYPIAGVEYMFTLYP